MNRYLLTALLLYILTGCSHQPRKTNGILSSKNLPSYYYALNADSAYHLRTPSGINFNIAANTFKAGKGERIKLEVKEALSMRDILQAGLTTQSDGRPLKSAGMVYFNATVDDQPAEFLKPVQVSVPAAAYDSSMQLFKGEIKADSSINWVSPQALDTTPDMKRLLWGKQLYSTQCASCHKFTENFTGPALAWCRERAPSRDWPGLFTNNAPMMVETDPYARALKSRYGSVMPKYNLGDDALTAIFDYCDNEVRLQGKTPPAAAPATDSIAGTNPYPCGFDTIYEEAPDSNATGLLTGKDQLLENYATDSSYSDTDTSAYNKNYTRYGFWINNSGWYNIDCFMDQYKSLVQPVKLTLTVQSPDPAIQTTAYLCIPSRKLLTDAYGNDGKEFRFAVDDNFKLIPGDKAFVFAVGSSSEKIYYSIKSFAVSKELHLELVLKESTNTKIIQSLKKNGLDDAQVDDYKNPKYEADTADFVKEDSIAVPYITDTVPFKSRPYTLVPRPCDGIKNYPNR